MSSFFTFRPSSTPVAGRVVVGMCLLGLGSMGFAIIQFAFNPVDYTTTQFIQVYLYEWLPVAMPIFLALVPTVFLALLEIFQHTSWKRLLLITIIGGIVLTFPAYEYNLRRWQPLVRTIRDLPLKEATYHRHTGTLGPGRSAGMGITFITPKESFPWVKQKLETQLEANKDILVYRLEDSHPLSVNYYDSETPEGEIRVSLYVRPVFR